MPRSIEFRLAVLVLVSLLLSACSTPIAKAPADEIDKVYDSVHGQGSQDAVKLLRQGMRERKIYGVTQPSIPVRNAEDVRQIWVPDHVDPVTARLIHGHWESAVLKEGTWYVEE